MTARRWAALAVLGTVVALSTWAADRPGGSTDRTSEPMATTATPEVIHRHADVDRVARAGLEKKVTVELKGTPLRDVAGALAQASGLNVVFDESCVKNGEVDPTKPITLNLVEAPLREVLESLFPLAGARHRVRHGIVLITDDQYDMDLETRIYPVGDLVFAPKGVDMADVVEELVCQIQSDLVSDTWSENGGLGAISFSSPSLCLIITQNGAGHQTILEFIRNLKEAKVLADDVWRKSGGAEKHVIFSDFVRRRAQRAGERRARGIGLGGMGGFVEGCGN